VFGRIRFGHGLIRGGLVGLAMTLAIASVATFNPTHAAAAPKGDANAGDVWLDNVGQPSGPGHEHDPHLACADINLWGAGLADSSGTYTIDGWPPSGSQEQDYPATGAAGWTYTGGSSPQVTSVISVNALIANAVANGDAPINKQGFHFKLQFSQDPQKHKTFWVNCPAPQAPTVAVWVQTLDSCATVIPGAQFALADSGGTTIATATGASGPSVTLAHLGCPRQGGDCVSVSTGCLSFSLTVPATGTATYKITETAAPTGYVPCEGGSACRLEFATLTIDSSGNVKGNVTNVYPDGTVVVRPISDVNTGLAYYTATQSDPIVFNDDKLGNVSCDGDNDADDHDSGSPSSHCDSDAD
jgi:hypothetical protein